MRGSILALAMLTAGGGVALREFRVRARLRGYAQRLAGLQHMAMTDELTGLPNRRLWEEQLPSELARAQRHDQPIYVVMLDLDRFKLFNDANGHLAGDRLLKAAASAWRGALRPYDLLARYGGEEFSLILFGCARADAVMVVERLRSVTPGEQTLSAGLAEWDRSEPASALVERADAALYAAKRAGRNRAIVSIAVPESPGTSDTLPPAIADNA
jgi:diguanylate cyclase (GGDEF)-like protein